MTHFVTFFLIGIVGYIVIDAVFKKIFNNGRVDQEGWMVFNLSIFAEMLIVFIYLSAGIGGAVLLFISKVVWYGWIMQIMWILYFFIKGILVYVNRNNYIRIKGNELQYQNVTKSGSLQVDSFNFQTKSSNALSIGSSSGWFLELRSDKRKKPIELDLRDMNMNGFKGVIQKCLLDSNIKQH